MASAHDSTVGVVPAAAVALIPVAIEVGLLLLGFYLARRAERGRRHG